MPTISEKNDERMALIMKYVYHGRDPIASRPIDINLRMDELKKGEKARQKRSFLAQ
jgi:hypothetical protein